MKKILAALAAFVVAILVVMGVRTARFTPAPAPARSTDTLPAVNDSLLAVHLAGAVKFPTVSFQDLGPPVPCLLALHKYLEATFPLVHSTLAHEVVAPANLLFKWAGTDTTLEPVVMMAHMDVVPVENSATSAWTHVPFGGDIADGFVWGRGTLDDKVGVLSDLEAVESLIKSGYHPKRTIYLAFGDDEEVTGNGALAIVTLLKSRGVHPLVAVDEGGAIVHGIIPGVSKSVALIGLAEKGHASLELRVVSAGGHSSMPPAQTAVGILAQAIDRLEKSPFPAKLEGSSAGMFDQLGREMPFTTRVLFANLWLTRPLVLSVMSKSATTSASFRTTTAPTMLFGSPKDNVLPSLARGIVNFRIIPGETPQTVMQRVRDVIDDPRVTVAPSGEQVPPSPTSTTTSASYATIARDIRILEPDAIVAPSLVVAATDSRQYGSYARDVYRFLPISLTAEDLDRIHGTNERIGIHDYARGVAFMTKLIADLASQ